jgi:glycosyltransferase involved in cell wall biosynthesis
VYLPHSYAGRGPAESCVQLLSAFPGSGWNVHLYLTRARRSISCGIKVHDAAGPLLRHVPYRLIERWSRGRLKRRFRRALDRAPAGSVAWFWPDAPIDLVRYARDRGMVTVREMINSPWAHARPILDAAFAAAGLPPTHGISEESIARENAELAQYDFVYACNGEVEEALRMRGIAESRILRSSFGWSRSRFPGRDRAESDGGPFRACFVGTVNVRKGIAVLLEAWRLSGIQGELLLAGTIEEGLRPLVEQAIREGSGIVELGPLDEPAQLYRTCDVFVFPTFEEGGPQVTYEAAACGLPIITTPMGAARLVVDGATGLIVPPGNPPALADALRRMAGDPALRETMARAACHAVQKFEYRQVSEDRVRLLETIACRQWTG